MDISSDGSTCPYATKSISTWKFARVPCKVLFAVRVFDVEPHDVHRDVKLVELGVDHVHVLLVVVVPPT